MPFSLQHSGSLKQVIDNAKKEAEKQHLALGDNAVAKAGLALVHKLLDCLRSVVTEFPDESDAGLVLTGDAGEKHLSISNLVFSASKPMAPADLETYPVPVKDEPVKVNNELPPPEQPTTPTIPPTGTF